MRFTKEELKEFMLKEIKIIQDIIKRMASNSFSIEKMDHCSCYSNFTFKRNYIQEKGVEDGIVIEDTAAGEL